MSQNKILELEDKIETQANALLKLQSQNKTTIERLPQIISGGSTSNTSIGNMVGLTETIKTFLRDKEKVRSLNRNPSSNLEKYLNNNLSKAWNWNVGNLLEELDKWAEGVR